MPEPTKNVKNHNVAYWQLRPFWTDCLNLKEPLPTTLPLYLNRYAKEDDVEFAERIKRLANVNVIDIVLDAYLSMLFSTDIRISSVKYQEQVDKFVKRCNQKGDSLKEYFREIVAPMSLLYGITDVFVDLPSLSGDVQSLEQQREAGVDAPYCYAVPPLNRTMWELNDAGEYVAYRSLDIINTQVAALMQVKDKHQYNEWTLDTVTVYDNKGSQKEQRDNPFGFIPAVSVIPLPSMRFYDDRLGVSLVQNVMPLQKLILNLISLVLDFHESVNFSMRVYKQDTTNGDEPPAEGELSEGGNKRGLIIRGPQSDYKIVSPDAAGVEAMSNFLNGVMEWAFQDAKLPSDANMNKTHQSEKTIRGNFAPLYNRLTRMSKHFEKAKRQIIEMALRVQGLDPSDAGVSVSWGTNFSYESFINSIEELTALRKVVQDMTPTAVAEITRKVVGPQLYNSEKITTIDQEIEEWVKKALADPVGQPDPNKLPTTSQQVGDAGSADKVASEEGEGNN